MPSLPSAQSTGEAGKELIAPIMSPAMEPIKAAGAALGNPLQTLGAPPAVMAAAAAMGTMFGGDSDTPEEKLKNAGEDLSESSDKLDESAEGLGALGSMIGLENLETILEDIRDSVFSLEKKLVGQMRQEKGAVDEETGKKVGGQFMGFREAREKVDPTARLRAIEEKREAARAAKKPGKTPGESPAEEEMDDIDYFKNAMKMGIMKLLGPVIGFFKSIMSFFGKIVATAKVWGPKILKFTKGFGKLMGKLFLPITILIGAVSMITGFIEGFKEGGIIEGFKQGFMNVISNLIDMPLNLIKDMISWMAGVLGFDEFAADLDSFEFDFAGLFGQFFDVAVTWVKDTFNEVWPKIKELFTLEGMIQFFEGYVNTMFDAPLNWIKGLVASVLRFFGAEGAANEVDEFEFDLSGGVRKLFTAISDTFSNLWIQLKETLTEVWETIKAVFSLDNIKSTLSNIPVIGGWFKGDEEAAAVASPAGSGPTSEKPAAGALGVQEPDDGWWSKVSSIFNESALQRSEQAAAAAAPQGGGATVVNAPSTQINNSSGQTMIAAPKAIIRGESVLESAAFQP